VICRVAARRDSGELSASSARVCREKERVYNMNLVMRVRGLCCQGSVSALASKILTASQEFIA